jgi:2-polyprenyl-6-methoxyphenol hydroxylase-like FAD-dependent oxidoreductase
VTTAVVLGGGFAGMLAAAVLARQADVTVVESDSFPAGPAARPGLPQAHHNHVLMGDGAVALEKLLPGTMDALLAQGARRHGMTGGALILGSAGWFVRHDTGAYAIACSRWLMDHVVRQRALAGGDISVRERTRMLGLTGDASRVTGVVVQSAGAAPEEIRADLVIDATGRRSQARRWLAGIGVPPVAEDTVGSGLAYSTRVYRAPADLAAVMPAIMIHPAPGAGRPDQGATLFPIEDDRWIVTLTGTRGGEPPVDERGFTAFAQSLRTAVVAELTAAAAPVGGIRPFGATANRRRYFERARLPEGFLAIGDAVIAVNPMFSHGMSVAALSVLRLADELTRHGAQPSVLPRAQAAILAGAERSWQVATGGGAQSPACRPVQAAMALALPGSPVLLTEFFRAQALTPPAPAPRGSLEQELARAPGPSLTADEAIAQYPGLSDWWLATRRPRTGVPAGVGRP